MHDLLKNKKYIGIYTFGRVKTAIDGSRNNHKDELDMIEIPGGVPAIISTDLWQAVQKKLQKNKKAPGSYKAKGKYLLSGRIRCEECGSTMVGGTFTTKGKRYSYYKCTKPAIIELAKMAA